MLLLGSPRRLLWPFLVAWLALAFVTPPPAGAVSATTTGHLPFAVAGAPAAVVNGTAYLLGGRLADGTYSDAIVAYDPAMQTSTVLPTKLPVIDGAFDKAGDPVRARQAGSTVAIEGRIYYFGGAALEARTDPTNASRKISSPRSLQDVVEFDPATGSIRTLPQKLPYEAWSTSAVAWGGSAYVFGGGTYDASVSPNITRHDTIVTFRPGGAGAEVGVLPVTLPYPLDVSTAAVVGVRAFVFGGLMNGTADVPCPAVSQRNATTGATEMAPAKFCLADGVVALDLANGTSGGVVAKMPYRAQAQSSAVVGGRIYVAGGRSRNDAPLSTVFTFDPASAAHSGPQLLPLVLPVALSEAGIMADGQAADLFGGRGVNASMILSDVTRLDLAPSAPSAPSSLVAKVRGRTIQLSWGPPYYDGGAPVTSYQIHRRAAGGPDALVASPQNATYTDACDLGVPLVYSVVAVNSAGVGTANATVSATCGAGLPGPVRALDVAAGNGLAKLRWTPPADVGDGPVTEYRIYANGSDAPVANASGGNTSAIVSGLQNGLRYSFTVTAVSDAGEGAPSDAVAVVPRPVPDAPRDVAAATSAAGVGISWTAPPPPIRSFVVSRGPDASNLSKLHELPASASADLDTTAVPGTRYCYGVSAVNDVGAGPISDVACVGTIAKPGAPTALLVVNVTGRVAISWSAPADLGGVDPSVVVYAIERDGRTIANDVHATSFEDRGVVAGRSYQYGVIADNGMRSDPSAALRVTVVAPPAASEPGAGNDTPLATSPPATNGSTDVSPSTPATGAATPSAPAKPVPSLSGAILGAVVAAAALASRRRRG